MATKNKTKDELAKELFDSVQKKKIAIEKAERPVWITGGNFGYSASSAHDRTDLRLVTDVRKIVDMLAFLIDRQEKSEKAAKRLGVEYEFKWLGFTIDEWENDFVTRVNQIQIQQKRKDLSDAEARLKTISPELRDKLELASIQDMLNKQ
jgi:hypothetical protein